jgi:hypothetical protein
LTPPPPPLAPRPYPGEALSSWVRRIAARYSIFADDLVTYVLGWRSGSGGWVERLDHRADPVLEAALAAAARVDSATIKALRVVCKDGSASCWHRIWPAWCPACIGADLAGRGEIYERASWRLGCCVLCPDHGVPLEDACGCWPPARWRFQGVKGRLQLACEVCRGPVDPATVAKGGPNLSWLGVRDIGPVLRVLRNLQGDLQRALAASPPRQSWGLVRSAGGLITAVRDLTLAVIVASQLKFEQRIVLPELRSGRPFAPVLEPVTPAALSVATAANVLARAAAVLWTLGWSGKGMGQWVDLETDLMSAASFVAWLSPPARGLLAVLANGWEQPARDALCALIARVENAARG